MNDARCATAFVAKKCSLQTNQKCFAKCGHIDSPPEAEEENLEVDSDIEAYVAAIGTSCEDTPTLTHT